MPPRPSHPRLTHFLCIPLVTALSQPQLQRSLTTFRNDVTNKSTPENPDGIPEKAIRPLGTLHLTLAVMSLLSQERVEKALNILNALNLMDLLSPEKIDESLISLVNSKRICNALNVQKDLGHSSSLSVTLRGLRSMHTPSKTSILYSSPVDPGNRLQLFCKRIRDIFAEADLLVPDTRPLLLHATIVNTIYVPANRGRGSGHGGNRAKLNIDAREILEEYKAFEWMKDVRVENVAICQMGAKKLEDGEEEYVVEGEIWIP